ARMSVPIDGRIVDAGIVLVRGDCREVAQLDLHVCLRVGIRVPTGRPTRFKRGVTQAFSKPAYSAARGCFQSALHFDPAFRLETWKRPAVNRFVVVRVLLGELSGRLCEPSRPGLTRTEPFPQAGMAPFV